MEVVRKRDSIYAILLDNLGHVHFQLPEKYDEINSARLNLFYYLCWSCIILTHI